MTRTKPESHSSSSKVATAKTKPARKTAAKPKRTKTPKYTRAEIEAIFERFHAHDPEPKGELEYVNAFTLLVAVVLSAQATDAGVNRATRGLFAVADTPEKMLALGEDGVREAIKTIGLFRNKAKNVVALSQMLIEKHGGEVPRSREELEELPGVGRKTANVVLNIAFGEPTVAVDTHLFRIGNRLGIAPGKTPLAVELALEKIIPDAYRLHAHHWLILHGRYVCKARTPDCGRCIIADLCKSPEKRVPDASKSEAEGASGKA
ncbi:endonuclease III [Breoghania sp.]|uniref:endonuclease III n=1 Tax=Breoghania sp. TaxID=2065378 RepID=UPI002AA8FC90|nr:endonuclease III [Breoghania sp.]